MMRLPRPAQGLGLVLARGPGGEAAAVAAPLVAGMLRWRWWLLRRVRLQPQPPPPPRARLRRAPPLRPRHHLTMRCALGGFLSSGRSPPPHPPPPTFPTLPGFHISLVCADLRAAQRSFRCLHSHTWRC